MIIPVLFVFSDWALLILRLAVGAVFLAHGWPKLKNYRPTLEWFHSVGFKPGWFWGTLVIALETAGSALLILCLFTQALGFLLAGQMAVAALWKIKQGKGLMDGYELDLLLAAACLILATMGGGRLALGF